MFDVGVYVLTVDLDGESFGLQSKRVTDLRDIASTDALALADPIDEQIKHINAGRDSLAVSL